MVPGEKLFVALSATALGSDAALVMDRRVVEGGWWVSVTRHRMPTRSRRSCRMPAAVPGVVPFTAVAVMPTADARVDGRAVVAAAAEVLLYSSRGR